MNDSTCKLSGVNTRKLKRVAIRAYVDEYLDFLKFLKEAAEDGDEGFKIPRSEIHQTVQDQWFFRLARYINRFVQGVKSREYRVGEIDVTTHDDGNMDIAVTIEYGDGLPKGVGSDWGNFVWGEGEEPVTHVISLKKKLVEHAIRLARATNSSES